MSETINIQNVLTNVGILSKKYDEIAKITGDNFNIFSVMRMESDEVRTHSRIIAELLNPKGTHSQGSVFLKLFFEAIDELKRIENFDFENAKIIVEEHIGTINEDYTKGGYIDIVIKDSRSQIVIENKIYASDQYGQLLRYKNHYPNCKLLYLTLGGTEPSNDSIGHLELDIDFYCISYKHNILSWLENCHKQVIDQPMIREVIKHYVNLVKKLTNQTINNNMSEEIVEVLSKNIKESFDILASISALKDKLYKEFMRNIIDFAESNNMTITDESDADKEYGVYLHPKEWSNKQYNICVIFEADSYNGFYYGLSYMEITPEDKTVLREKFKNNNYQESDWWIWQYHTKCDWGDNSEIWIDVAKGKEGEIYKEVIDKIKEIIEIEKQ